MSIAGRTGVIKDGIVIAIVNIMFRICILERGGRKTLPDLNI
jgi:hypothetical protein